MLSGHRPRWLPRILQKKGEMVIIIDPENSTMPNNDKSMLASGQERPRFKIITPRMCAFLAKAWNNRLIFCILEPGSRPLSQGLNCLLVCILQSLLEYTPIWILKVRSRLSNYKQIEIALKNTFLEKYKSQMFCHMWLR